jgi:uncharacterized protein (TIGR03067 family)
MSQQPRNTHEHDSAFDLAALQGAWEQIEHQADGVCNPPDEHGAPGALTTFVGNHFAVRTIEGILLLEGRFELDAAARPKAITWIDSMGSDKGKRLPASYALDGDHFVFIAGNEGTPRPVIFRTVPGQTMRTFVRRS